MEVSSWENHLFLWAIFGFLVRAWCPWSMTALPSSLEKPTDPTAKSPWQRIVATPMGFRGGCARKIRRNLEGKLWLCVAQTQKFHVDGARFSLSLWKMTVGRRSSIVVITKNVVLISHIPDLSSQSSQQLFRCWLKPYIAIIFASQLASRFRQQPLLELDHHYHVPPSATWASTSPRILGRNGRNEVKKQAGKSCHWRSSGWDRYKSIYIYVCVYIYIYIF